MSRLRRGFGARGQATVELAIVLPLLLLLTLGVIQLALLFAARQLTGVAAFQAARAELTGDDSFEAAVRILAPLTAGAAAEAGIPDHLSTPGWGPLDHSGIAARRTYVQVIDPPDDGPGEVEVEVTYDCLLLFPLGGMFNILNPGRGDGDDLVYTEDRREFFRIKAREVMPRPWLAQGLPE